MKTEFKDMEMGVYFKPFDWRSFLKFGIGFSPELPLLEIKLGPFFFEIGWIYDESVQGLPTSDQRDQT